MHKTLTTSQCPPHHWSSQRPQSYRTLYSLGRVYYPVCDDETNASTCAYILAWSKQKKKFMCAFQLKKNWTTLTLSISPSSMFKLVSSGFCIASIFDTTGFSFSRLTRNLDKLFMTWTPTMGFLPKFLWSRTLMLIGGMYLEIGDERTLMFIGG